MWKKVCYNRCFELKVVEEHRKGTIKDIPIYVSLGHEHIPAILSELIDSPNIFAQHRCHSYYLSFGGDPKALVRELLCMDDGCNLGRGGSASISTGKMFGHSGLLGDQVPIGVGYALGSNELTVVVCGDAAIEECYALSSLGFAASRSLPVLFICEDNNLSILTEKKVRRTWTDHSVARSFGMSSYSCHDNITSFVNAISKACEDLPAYVNVSVCRQYWHAGSGQDGEPKWDYFKNMKDTYMIPTLGKDLTEFIWEQAVSDVNSDWAV